MKRLHVHVGVNDLDQSIRFYSTLFGAEPTVLKDDYAKWMLDDPRVNFAISQGNHAKKGIEHLGIQVESTEELSEEYGRLRAADRPATSRRALSAAPGRSHLVSRRPARSSTTTSLRRRRCAAARLATLSGWISTATVCRMPTSSTSSARPSRSRTRPLPSSEP